jgi:hypothetical protein
MKTLSIVLAVLGIALTPLAAAGVKNRVEEIGSHSGTGGTL